MISTVLGFLIGICIGSFVKAVSERLIQNKTIWGRSYCQNCHKQLKAYDLFPVLSYILLKGRCRFCKKKIPSSLFITEIILGVCMALLFWLQMPNLENILQGDIPTLLALASLLFAIFIVIIIAIVFIVDLETGLILDKVSIPATIGATVFLFVFNLIRSILFYNALKASPLGKYLLPPNSNYFLDQLKNLWYPLGYALLTGIGLSLFFVSIIILTRGKGMGWGDVKYVLFLGIALGFPNGILAIFLAFFLGAIISLLLISINKKRFGQTIPFGPFLSIGAFIALLYGQKMIEWYLSLSIR